MICVDAADGAIIKIAEQEVSLLIEDQVIGSCIAFENYVRCVVLGCCWRWSIGGCSGNGRYLGSRSGWCHRNSARRGVCRSSGTGYEDKQTEEQERGAIDTGMMLEHGVSFQVMYGKLKQPLRSIHYNKAERHAERA